MRVLELGTAVTPAYAGMLLAEQGIAVAKWHQGDDPLLSTPHGEDLWQWLKVGKILRMRPAQAIIDLEPQHWPNAVIDNYPPSTLETWGIDPAQLARRMRCAWVSMRSEVGELSPDLMTQCRSWMEYGPRLPFAVGDTTGGLWLAFKALALVAAHRSGHFLLGQATCMEKLVEGGLASTAQPAGVSPASPWWEYFDGEAQEVIFRYKGQEFREPVRNRVWKMAHLWHDGEGRMRI